MEKRVLIAVVLSIAVMYGFSYFFPQPSSKTAKLQVAQQGISSARQPAAGTAATITAPLPAALPTSQAPEREVTVETDLYKAVFTTRGASLKQFVLKKYREDTAKGSPEIALVNGSSPLTLTSSADGFPIDPNATFTTTSGNVAVSGTDKKDIEFVWTSAQGVTFRKIYTVTGNGYGIDLNQQLANAGTAPVNGVLRLILANKVAAGSKTGRYEVHGPVTLSDDKVVSLSIADLAKGAKTYDKQLVWTGFADKYFLNCIIAKDASLASAQVTQAGAGVAENIVSSQRLTIAPGQTATVPCRLYFGPKDLEILKGQGSRLEEVIDFGWFSVLAKPLLFALKFFYSFTHNYGLAIIIITVILKIFFYPLTHKSYKSMKEMQKLQPKMQALKEKFKNDRDAMNRAVMELYREHKVNPLGGCLPMVVQIPVFFALYKALMFSIELRHAPFYFWIQDLSAKDPYYVTPILMGASMFIQQKMTPTNMDPMQEKMMLMLPAVFTFMFLSFPSGLVLYWLVNNILTIAQQAYINKSLKEA
ncbi:MAG: membrane protein insertase YidC [Geobacter sp.]|nr:membrane protein insertase YidC [Geobacter sp.]